MAVRTMAMMALQAPLWKTPSKEGLTKAMRTMAMMALQTPVWKAPSKEGLTMRTMAMFLLHMHQVGIPPIFKFETIQMWLLGKKF